MNSAVAAYFESLKKEHAYCVWRLSIAVDEKDEFKYSIRTQELSLQISKIEKEIQ